MTSPFSTGRRGVSSGGTPSAGGGVKVQGAEALLVVSKRLKAAGETGLRKEFHKGLQQAAKPLIPLVRAAALADLPKHGKLNVRIARKPYRAQVRTGAKTAGVRIVGTKVDPRINAQGRVAHPVFGRPKSTVVQQVPAAKGYFDETIRDQAPRIRNDITDVLAEFARRMMRKA